MYDINTKNVKKGIGFYLIFLLAGLFFLGLIGWILISSYNNLNSLDSKIKSTKVIVNSHTDDGSILYSPIYYYNVNGREYSCASDSSSSINPGTSNKIVYYDSNNPSICMTDYSKSNNYFLLIFFIIPLVFIILAIVNMRKIGKRLKLIKELNKTGKLVKNLPYHLEGTGMAVNGVQIQRPVAEYPLPSGSLITLYGDPRHDKKGSDADGLVDVVIDESNTDNYFVDFEINRLTGNLATDYYDNIQTSQEQDTKSNNEQVVQPQPLSNNINNLEQSQTVVQQPQTNQANNLPNSNQ